MTMEEKVILTLTCLIILAGIGIMCYLLVYGVFA